ncbi:MAG: hypothetical protein IKE08_10285, partial [Clostridia bacterium]|nr:hypothetical protein [Clostridia bacterium]
RDVHAFPGNGDLSGDACFSEIQDASLISILFSLSNTIPNCPPASDQSWWNHPVWRRIFSFFILRLISGKWHWRFSNRITQFDSRINELVHISMHLKEEMNANIRCAFPSGCDIIISQFPFIYSEPK